MELRPKTDLRHEIKFLVNQTQQQALLNALRDQLHPDSYGDGVGQYAVTSLYYDTPDYKAYWDKVDGFDFRRKLRVRVYGDPQVEPETPIFFEIKARVGNRMGKRRVRLSYAAAMALATREELATTTNREGTTATAADQQIADGPVLDELHYLFAALPLQPAAVVSYQRLAYGGHANHPDLRITFDTAVRGRVENLSLLSADEGSSQTVLAPGWAILEVKVNQTVPFWLGELLSHHGCTPRRISKYCATLERCNVIRRRQHILL